MVEWLMSWCGAEARPGPEWAAVRACGMAEWLEADVQLREASVGSLEAHPRLAAWPPYELCREQGQNAARERLYGQTPAAPKRVGSQQMRPQHSWMGSKARQSEMRRSVPDVGSGGTQHCKPPSADWVNSVIVDWVLQLYSDVRAPLEPLLGLIREIVARDEGNDEQLRVYSLSLNLPRLKDELTDLMRQRLSDAMCAAYSSAAQRLGDWYEPRNPLRRLLCDSWAWAWHAAPTYIMPWALESFVEQASPCCAAASAAGAINALTRRSRPSYCQWSVASESAAPGRALTAEDALCVMDRALVSMIVKSASSAAVDLPAAAAEELVTRVAEELQPGGVIHSVPPTTKAQQMRCLDYVRELLVEVLPRDRDALLRLDLDVGVDPRRRGCRHLYGLINNVWGLAKLRCKRPSTARFGSWGVVMAVEQLGKGAVPGVCAAIQSACDYTWAEFQALLCRHDCSIIVHLPNHYACVFAVRGECLLTARKGQPPTDWVRWDELQTIQRRSSEGVVIVVYRGSSPPPLKTAILGSFRQPSAPVTRAQCIAPETPPVRKAPVPTAAAARKQTSVATGSRSSTQSPAAEEQGRRPRPTEQEYGRRPQPADGLRSLARIGAAGANTNSLQWCVASPEGVLVHEHPRADAAVVGVMRRGEKFTELQREAGFLRHVGGWTKQAESVHAAFSKQSSLRRGRDAPVQRKRSFSTPDIGAAE
eukprot:TRINITY_DN4115_c0_g2_i1.p1 TRINITY_DN4115_c0_g2~~TRINITY_DN4115_c0_g2_i1.p1  ORF type:complete len:706 (+),score=94.78 TRINITY_DN4115_c0_g2_i1:48-2165(+)